MFLSRIGKASGTSWYVNPDGTDGVTCGTSGSPCKSLEYAIETRSPANGDTVILQAGAGSNYNVSLFKSGTDKAIVKNGLNLTITAEQSAFKQMVIDVPDATAQYTQIMQLSGTVTWKGIRFTNTYNQAVRFFWITNDEIQNLSFEDCYFNDNTNIDNLMVIGSGLTYDTSISFERCDFYIQKGTMLGFLKTDTISASSISMKSCRLVGVGTIVPGPSIVAAFQGSFSAINCTFVLPYTDLFGRGFNTNANLTFVNNLFLSIPSLGDTASGAAPIWLATYPRAGTFNIHNNIFWNAYQTKDTTVGNIGLFAKSTDNTLAQLEKRNWWLDPAYDGNYNLGAGSKALGRGDSSVLPLQDLNGVSWSGPHIGCYSNPSTTVWTMTPRTGKIVIIGDSIALGTGIRGQTAGQLASLFGSAPFEVVGIYNDFGSNDFDQNMAEGGRGIEEVFGLIDRAAEQQQPQYAFFYYGANNIDGDGTVSSPSGMTSSSFAAWTKIIMDKASDWGITPVWIGMSPAKEGDHTTQHNTWNGAVEAAISGTYAYDSMTKRFIVNSKYNQCSTDGGYYSASLCAAQCGSGGDCLSQNVHPTTNAQDLALSLIYNLNFNKTTYIVNSNNQTIDKKVFNGAPLIPAVSVMSGVTGTKIRNCTIYGLTKGTWLQANAEISNTLFNSNTTDIHSDGGTATQSHNYLSSESDPKFVSVSGGDFHLQYNSPAINAGTDVGFTQDNEGNSVPQGSAPDIGAFEFLAPSPPSSLGQFKSDGSTSIQNGGQTDDTTAMLKFSMLSNNSSDLLTPQIEIQPIEAAFTNTVTNSGTAVSSSGSTVTGTVTVSGLTSGVQYHWQARVGNAAGQSAWVAKGQTPDFGVDTEISAGSDDQSSVDQTSTDSTDQGITLTTSSSEYIPTIFIGNNKIVNLSPTEQAITRIKQIAFRGKLSDANLSLGKVELRKDSKFYKKALINKRGRWRITTKDNVKQKNIPHTYQFIYYDQSGNVVEDSNTYTILIDRQKPNFTKISKTQIKNPGDIVTFGAADNNQINHYNVTFRGWKSISQTPEFIIPQNTPKGTSVLAISAVDRAGNIEKLKLKVIIR